MTNCEYCGTKLQWHGGSWEPPADERDAKIARLRELLAEWLKFPYPDARTDKLAEATEKALRGEE
jgi:hypothetical protein